MNINEIVAAENKETRRKRYARLYQRQRRAGERALRYLCNMAQFEKRQEMRRKKRIQNDENSN